MRTPLYFPNLNLTNLIETAGSNLFNFSESLLGVSCKLIDTMSDKSSMWLHFVKMNDQKVKRKLCTQQFECHSSMTNRVHLKTVC